MTEKQLIIQRYFKQYYKDNKSKIKAANRNRYFKDHENRKAYGRAQQKVYYQNEKEKLIKEVVDRVRVKFFDEEFIPDDEVKTKKRKRRKNRKKSVVKEIKVKEPQEPKKRIRKKREWIRKERIPKVVKSKNPNRVPFGYWLKKFPAEDFNNDVDRRRAIWNAQMKAKAEIGYYRSEGYKEKQRAYKKKMLHPIISQLDCSP